MAVYRAKALVVIEVEVEADNKHEAKSVAHAQIPDILTTPSRNRQIVHYGDPVVSMVEKQGAL